MIKEKTGIYIHIPFCISKCKYCDFLSFPMEETGREEYTKAILREIDGFEAADKYTVVSIFIGGGTPTVLDKSQLTRIMDCIYDKFELAPDAEITIECNPKTADLDKLKALRDIGVNRLSIGVQSMEDRFLKVLGRVHALSDVYDTFSMAVQAGFSNINADLMFSLPGQTVDDWKKTLEMALRLNPTHISAYSLIIEENTPFFDRYQSALCMREAGKVQDLLPSEEDEIKMYELTQEILRENGFEQYEISNFARPGFKSVHNDGYWLRRNYIGFGLGAASLIDNTRFENTRNFNEYIELASGIWKGNLLSYSGESLSREDAMAETMFLGLRRTQGISMSKFKEDFGTDIMEVYGPVIKKQEGEGFLCVNDDRIFLTKEGNLISNICLAEYLPD